MEEECMRVQEEVDRAKAEYERRQQVFDNLQRQIFEQQEKIDRADKNLKRVFKEIRASADNFDATLIFQQEVTSIFSNEIFYNSFFEFDKLFEEREFYIIIK